MPPWLSPRHAAALRAGMVGMILLMLPQDRSPTLVQRTGVFQSPLITESSGVAASRRFPGVLWTHNDSGDGPWLYATNLEGRDLGRYWVTGASNQDWEDLALAPCPQHQSDCLYIADTGDNNERRSIVAVYLVPEPDLLPARPATGPSPPATVPARAVYLRYPDRPHDVEALWVNPDGSLELVTKGTTGPVLRYRVSQPRFRHDTVTAELLDTLPIVPQRALGRLVTGAALAPDGHRVVIRTYTELFFFERRQEHQLRLLGAPCWLGTLEPQGEGVAFLDSTTLVLTSEAVMGQRGPIHRVQC